MYSKKILTCMGSLQICSQNNQYDLYWNSFWFQMRQLWKFQQLLIALIYETVTPWPCQVTVQLFNEHLALRTSYFMLLVEVLNLNFCPMFWIWHMTACVRFRGKTWQKPQVFLHLNIFLEFKNSCICQIQRALVNSHFFF